jgi:nitrate reductase NapA
MQLDRREFLHVSALAAANAVVAQRLAGQASLPAAPASPVPASGDGIKWDKAPCRFCGTGCHVRVGVRDGRLSPSRATGSPP